MKLKTTFSKGTGIAVPVRQVIRTWTQLLFGTRHSLHSLAMAEQPGSGWHGMPALIPVLIPVRNSSHFSKAAAKARLAIHRIAPLGYEDETGFHYGTH